MRPIKVISYLTEIRHRIDRDPVDIFYFIDIVCWDKEIRIPSSDRVQDTRKQSVNPLYRSIQSQFSEKKCLSDQFSMLGLSILA